MTAAGAGARTADLSDVPLIVFLHVPKTGGTSFRAYLRHAFPEGLVRAGRDPVEKSGTVAAPTRELAEDLTVLREARALSGHQGYGRFDLAASGRTIIYLSIMRDPLSRILSLYNYQRTSQRRKRRLADDVTLHDLVRRSGWFRRKSRFLNRIENQQTRVMFGDPPDPSGVLAKERFIVGKLEHVQRFLDEIADVVPTVENGFRHANNKGPSYKDEIRAQRGYAEAEKIIREATAADQAFYDSFGEILVSEPMKAWRAERRRTD